MPFAPNIAKHIMVNTDIIKVLFAKHHLNDEFINKDPDILGFLRA